MSTSPPATSGTFKKIQFGDGLTATQVDDRTVRVDAGPGAAGGGIQFDTDNEGGWLYIQTNDTDEAGGSLYGYAIDLRDRAPYGSGINIDTFKSLVLHASNNYTLNADTGHINMTAGGSGLHLQTGRMNFQVGGTGLGWTDTSIAIGAVSGQVGIGAGGNGEAGSVTLVAQGADQAQLQLINTESGLAGGSAAQLEATQISLISGGTSGLIELRASGSGNSNGILFRLDDSGVVSCLLNTGSSLNGTSFVVYTNTVSSTDDTPVNPVFTVDDTGVVHIKTGTSIVADL
jgi:hypothetical protein